jgi:hypothetical protein
MSDPTTLNIHQRLHAVMGEVDYIQKEKKAGMRYSIVSHDAVTAKVRPILHKHRVLYYPLAMGIQQNGNRTEVTLTVRFVNIDDASDWIDVETAGYGIDDQDKGPGKAISYAVKYALLKALGLESGDEPDEDQETTHRDPVVAAIEMALGLATNDNELAEVGQDIKKHADKLAPVQVARLRQLYAAKKKEIAA